MRPEGLAELAPPSLFWFGVALLAQPDRAVKLPRGAFDVDALAALRDALMSLGHEWRTVDGGVALSAPRSARSTVRLALPSPELSALVLLAAARGKPVALQGLASTPELVELAELLNQMGAELAGIGTAVARAGGATLTGSEARPGADRVEALFLLVASALCGSFVVEGVPAHKMAPELSRLQRAGLTVRAEGAGLVASGTPVAFDLAVADDPRPWLVLAMVAGGASVLSGPRLRDAATGELITTLVRLGADLLPRADLLYVGGGPERAPTAACGVVAVGAAENAAALLLLGLAGVLPGLELEIKGRQTVPAVRRVARALGLPADMG